MYLRIEIMGANFINKINEKIEFELRNSAKNLKFEFLKKTKPELLKVV